MELYPVLAIDRLCRPARAVVMLGLIELGTQPEIRSRVFLLCCRQALRLRDGQHPVPVRRAVHGAACGLCAVLAHCARTCARPGVSPSAPGHPVLLHTVLPVVHGAHAQGFERMCELVHDPGASGAAAAWHPRGGRVLIQAQPACQATRTWQQRTHAEDAEDLAKLPPLPQWRCAGNAGPRRFRSRAEDEWASAWWV